MWIEIDKTIFEKSDFKGINYLYQILSWFPNGSIPRYNVFVDLSTVEIFDNYRKLTSIEYDLEKLLEEEFNDFVNSHPKKSRPKYKVTSDKGQYCYNIEEAILFFNQPISIILENNKNDSYFIRAIIEYFDKEGTVKEHLKNGWIRFENAGGCTNVMNFLKGYFQTYESIALKNNRPENQYFRGFILLDSDKEYPTQVKKKQYEDLEKELKNNGIDNIHILEKRMMENYMPDEVFKALKKSLKQQDLLDWIQVYETLTDEQKDYLDYHKGSKISWNTLTGELAKLYKPISPTNYNKIKDGFKYPDFKTAFPKLFLDSPHVNKQSLKNRVATSELEDILQKIKNIL